MIVGFPGESDNYFQKTYDFLNGLDISYLHVFSYSMRENTDAVKIKFKILKNIILERSKMLHRLSIVKKQNFYKNNIESVKQILIENFEDGFLIGYSENYIPVRISGSPNEVNEIIPVKLVQIEDGEMVGERQA